jgi:hypothetical protein
VRGRDRGAVSYSGSRRTFNALVSYVERIPGPPGAALTFHTFWMTNLAMAMAMTIASHSQASAAMTD